MIYIAIRISLVYVCVHVTHFFIWSSVKTHRCEFQESNLIYTVSALPTYTLMYVIMSLISDMLTYIKVPVFCIVVYVIWVDRLSLNLHVKSKRIDFFYLKGKFYRHFKKLPSDPIKFDRYTKVTAMFHFLLFFKWSARSFFKGRW